MTTRYRADARPAMTAPPASLTTGPGGWYPLVAEHARNAQSFGRCCLCGDAYDRGARICDLADHTGKAHVRCVGDGSHAP